jgi:hypothetical protein
LIEAEVTLTINGWRKFGLEKRGDKIQNWENWENWTTNEKLKRYECLNVCEYR